MYDKVRANNIVYPHPSPLEIIRGNVPLGPAFCGP